MFCCVSSYVDIYPWRGWGVPVWVVWVWCSVLRRFGVAALAALALALLPSAAVLALGGWSGGLSVEWVRDYGGLDRAYYATDDLAWSPDGGLLAAASDGGYIVLVDPGTGDVVGELLGDLADSGVYISFVSRVAWSPDGGLLAAAVKIGGGDYELYVVSPSGAVAWNHTVDEIDEVRSVSWSPDGGRLAVVHGGNLTVFSREGGLLENYYLPSSGVMMAADWGASGEIAVAYYYYSDPSNDYRDTPYLDLIDASGEVAWERQINASDIDSPEAVRVSPDGGLIAVAMRSGIADAGSLLVFNASDGSLTLNITLPTIALYTLSWNPAHPSVVAVGGGFWDSNAATNNGSVVVVDTSTGEVLWEKNDFPSAVQALAWSPDGSRLAVGLYDDEHLIMLEAQGEWSQEPGTTSPPSSSQTPTQTEPASTTTATATTTSHGQGGAPPAGSTGTPGGATSAASTSAGQGGAPATGSGGQQAGGSSSASPTATSTSGPGGLAGVAGRVSPEMAGIAIIILLLLVLIAKR